MSLENAEAIRRWTTDAPVGFLKRAYQGGTIRKHADGSIMYQSFAGSRSLAWGPVILARWSPVTKTYILNGDGFNNHNATRWQTHLRNHIQRRNVSYVLIPYAAMQGAGIQWETVRPIQVLEDRFEDVRHEIPTRPALDSFPPPEGDALHSAYTQQVTKTHEKTRFRLSIQCKCQWKNKQTGLTTSYRNGPIDDYDRIEKDHVASRLEVWGTGEAGNGDWHPIDIKTPVYANNEQTQEYWTESVHRLGSSLFSAVGEDGKRHKFISAFDVAERQPLYFLAQLPDRSGATTYAQALDALAPPIVHSAIAEGRQVLRQGDVFAIATNMKDEEVYKDARSRVRREVALVTVDERMTIAILRGEVSWPEGDPEEVNEWAACPCRCGHRRRMWHGPKARNSLMIYGTAHTATEVVVAKNRATYVRGVMFHDPRLETPGRRPEHQQVDLGTNSQKWYLCVRNTVPRTRRPREQIEADAARLVAA